MKKEKMKKNKKHIKYTEELRQDPVVEASLKLGIKVMSLEKETDSDGESVFTLSVLNPEYDLKDNS
jgi:hypothetical protein